MGIEDLLLEITHCPVVAQCKSGGSSPCAPIVNLQPGPLAAFQVPEPWNGDIRNAPILFVSSNPSISDREQYPRWDSSDPARIDFFSHRFGGGTRQWITPEGRTLLADGRYGSVTRYLTWVRRRASELIGVEATPGQDYALTEIVRCKSTRQRGVATAATECVPRYLARTLRASQARVIVPVGKPARLALAGQYGSSPELAMTTRVKIEGTVRIVVPLGAPAGPEQKTFHAAYGATVETIRAHLAG